MVGLYHYLETVEPIKQLEREGRLAEALALCHGVIEGGERGRAGREPAPRFAEEPAIITANLANVPRMRRSCGDG